MMRLKARKGNLYRLTAQYESLPPRKQTAFCKMPHVRSWILQWMEGEDPCQAYFTNCLGTATLTIEKVDRNERLKYKKVHHIPLDKLRALGMAEEWTRASE